MTDSSVSQWISGLHEGDGTSIERLWDRYAQCLVALAKQRLRNVPLRTADEEDIAASVFESLCRGASEGRLKDLNNRDELWWLLLALTRRKVANHVRRETAEKRGGSIFPAIREIVTSPAWIGREIRGSCCCSN